MYRSPNGIGNPKTTARWRGCRMSGWDAFIVLIIWGFIAFWSSLETGQTGKEGAETGNELPFQTRESGNWKAEKDGCHEEVCFKKNVGRTGLVKRFFLEKARRWNGTRVYLSWTTSFVKLNTIFVLNRPQCLPNVFWRRWRQAEIAYSRTM